MRIVVATLVRSAIWAIPCVAYLSACGGLQPPSAPPVVPQSHGIATSLGRTESRMLPEAKREDLVYATTQGPDPVYVYNYRTGRLVGMLGGFQDAEGLCSDKNGNVFVADLRAQDIVEYAHGGTTPIATLNDNGNNPNGCAVDARTGNLAVAGGAPFQTANVAIYLNASGTPIVYPDPQEYNLWWCTYDSNSNLFISPWDLGAEGAIVELPAGSSNLRYIYLNQQVNPGGGIQWDGQHVVIGNPYEKGNAGPSTLYQLAISGSSATVIKTITLYGGKGKKDRNPRIGNEFWIWGTKVLDSTTIAVGTWSYPAGGLPTQRINGPSGMGLTLSVAPSD